MCLILKDVVLIDAFKMPFNFSKDYAKMKKIVI